MSLRRLIQDAYQERVRLADVPDDLRASLRAHERVPAFFRNLEHELARVPQLRGSQITDAVYSLTDTFIAAVKRAAEQRAMSDAARSAIREKAESDARRDALAERLLRGDPVDLEEIADG